MDNTIIPRSFVIPVLDFSAHSPYNIFTLLEDLDKIAGEVICIFNSPETFQALQTHQRIDKFCFNNLNAGVSRSWNMGLNLAEGRTVFILNADLHLQESAILQLESYLDQLEDAVIVGPQGSYLDFENQVVLRYFESGNFDRPIKTDDVSGFFFCIQREAFLQHKLIFDVQFSPCFFEEWDMGMQIKQAGLACYAVPVNDFEHHWGISQNTRSLPINYFGRDLDRNEILLENKKKFAAKWFERKSPAQLANRKNIEARPLYLGIASGDYFGWGVCSQNLIKELSKKTRTIVLKDEDGSTTNPNLDGRLLHALPVPILESLFKQARGLENYGYTFFENELTPQSYENARKYDLILAGSTWCRDRLKEAGIHHCDVLIQGIDPAVFYPVKPSHERDHFVVFSGGKFEFRKGQDLVLKAIKIIQEKYSDVILVNCWYNFWPKIMHEMAHSPYCNYEYKGGSWSEVMNHLYDINGLDPSKIVTLEPVPNHELREVYSKTDIGVFPNRCEGGTNLVMMEYMACGKPVIASDTSGHQDVVSEDNALLLKHLRDLRLEDDNKNLIARWQDPSLDELVDRIEFAYHHRDEIQRIGSRAGRDLQTLTWERTAQRLLDLIDHDRPV